MPFISRLKKLGTLPVPELQTTLTVYLINLEHSQETNLVYTSSNPLPADATPPADLRFECPEGYSKRGDVLIWASRVHKKACYVHACWVFNGHGWVKPSSDSEVMMDHPVHSDYQLVILSGPYVKWELKPDPDREPSLTVPDPPPLRPGARGSMNTILPSSLPSQHTSNAERSCPRPRSSDVASDTPDGSAAMCSSSRFSTPLSDMSDIPDGEVEISQSEPSYDAMPLAVALDPSLSRPLSGATQIVPAHVPPPEDPSKGTVHATIPPNSSTSLPRAQRERPKGARLLPSTRDPTPVAGAPPTPDSSMRTRTRGHLGPDIIAEKPKSSPLPRRRKRHRPVDDDDFVPTSPRPPVSASHPSTLRPSKRRRLGMEPQRTSGIRIRLPALPARADATKDAGIDSQENFESDASERPESFWDQLEELQKEKDTLATQVKEAADLAIAHSKLVREAKERDSLIEELRRQLAISQPAAHSREAAASFEEGLAEQQDKATKDSLFFERWKVDAIEKQTRMQGELDTATLRIRQLEERRLHAEASPTCAEAESDKQLTQLRHERDRACRTADEVRAELTEMRRQRDAALVEAKDPKRATNDVAIARTNDVTLGVRNIRQLEDYKKPEADLIQSKRDFEARLAGTRLDNDKFSQMQSPGQSRPRQQSHLEDTVSQLDEHKRRAASFEASLRVAQEALHRQRTHAQETEAVQCRTIAQLAKELQEKDQIAKELADKSESLERQVGDLRNSLAAQDNALKGERDNVRRAEAEIEQIRKSTQTDRLQIADLEATVASGRNEIVAANDKVCACQTLVDHVQQEKQACDAALAEEVRMRIDFEAQFLESQRSQITLQEMLKSAEDRLIQEDTAKHASASTIEAQRILFLEHLSISDRERRRLEELWLEHRSSLQLDLECKARDMESALAECAKLKAEYSVEREQLNANLSACNERQAEATEACKGMEVEIKRYQAELALATQALEHARLDFAASNSQLSTECDRLNQELCENRNRLEKMVSDSEVKLAEVCRHRQRIEEEFSALQLQFYSQTRDLESAKAECSQLKADASSERQHLTSQLSSMKGRLEEHWKTSQEQLAVVREEHKSAQDALQAQCDALELKACRVTELLKASQEGTAKLESLFRTDRERFEAELSSSHERLSSFELLLATANQERSNAERLFAEEQLLKERTVSENVSTVKELEDVRADLVKITADLATAHQLAEDTNSSQAKLKQELTACQSALAVAEEAGKREQVESRTIAHDLEESRAECSRLTVELACEREGFRAERSLSSDGLRSKLSSIEACLEHEKTTCRSLRKQLALEKEQSSNYWSDLGSQLLRSLHEVQDQLKVEQTARQALEDELALEQLKGQGFGACEALQNNV